MRAAVVVSLMGLVAAACSAAEPAMESAYWHAQADVQPAENVLLLYLRLAGSVWIFVEWIAAVVLVVAFYRLRRRLRQRGLVS